MSIMGSTPNRIAFKMYFDLSVVKVYVAACEGGGRGAIEVAVGEKYLQGKLIYVGYNGHQS